MRIRTIALGTDCPMYSRMGRMTNLVVFGTITSTKSVHYGKYGWTVSDSLPYYWNDK